MRNKMLDYQNDEFDYGHNISFESNEEISSLEIINDTITIKDEDNK